MHILPATTELMRLIQHVPIKNEHMTPVPGRKIGIVRIDKRPPKTQDLFDYFDQHYYPLILEKTKSMGLHPIRMSRSLISTETGESLWVEKNEVGVFLVLWHEVTPSAAAAESATLRGSATGKELDQEDASVKPLKSQLTVVIKHMVDGSLDTTVQDLHMGDTILLYECENLEVQTGRLPLTAMKYVDQRGEGNP